MYLVQQNISTNRKDRHKQQNLTTPLQKKKSKEAK